MPSPLRIPESHEAPLLRLASMPAERRAKLLHAIRSATAVLDPDDFISRICTETQSDDKAVGEIVRMLLSMYLASDRRRESFPERVVEAAKELWKEDAELVIWSSFSTDLTEILKCHDSLGVIAKVVDLRSEYARVYCSARVLTDVRPIFGRNPDDAPLGAAIVHTLRITYHDGDDSKDFHVALDSPDLQQLRQLVDRALKKEVTLGTEIEKTSMRVLEWGAE